MNQEKIKSFKRATAIKMHINYLISGNYIKDDVNNYLETEFGIRISRARILGTIVNKWMPLKKEDKNSRTPQATIILDDGTETIRIKAWNDDIKIFEDVKIGDIVDIIGRVRKYENEIYITPEIIRKIEDPNWELVRELEIIEYLKKIKSGSNLHSNTAESQQIPEKIVETSISDKSTIKDKIVELIRELDDGHGVNINQLKEHAGIPEIDFQDALTELINEGTIYQPSSGKYKIL
ncbi:MAG: OB-fold nucleic acid binding domain-containing protein [Promethearchaeota archaeon]